MKVRCTRIINSTTGEEAMRSHSLTRGKVYVVLAIVASPNRPIYLRIMDDEGINPALFASDQFTTLRTEMPSNWWAQVSNDGSLFIEPESWLRPGFWEDYFNAQPEALQDFERELSVIMGEAS